MPSTVLHGEFSNMVLAFMEGTVQLFKKKLEIDELKGLQWHNT